MVALVLVGVVVCLIWVLGGLLASDEPPHLKLEAMHHSVPGLSEAGRASGGAKLESRSSAGPRDASHSSHQSQVADAREGARNAGAWASGFRAFRDRVLGSRESAASPLPDGLAAVLDTELHRFREVVRWDPSRFGGLRAFSVWNPAGSHVATVSPAGVSFRDGVESFRVLPLVVANSGGRADFVAGLADEVGVDEELARVRHGVLEQIVEQTRTGSRHWFEVREGDAQAQTTSVMLAVASSAPLEFRPEEPGLFATWQDADGREREMAYKGLRVWDAQGRELEATMEWQEPLLALHVRSEGARFPLRIDPEFYAAGDTSLTYEGLTLASRGDVVAVGVPDWSLDNGALDDTNAMLTAALAAFGALVSSETELEIDLDPDDPIAWEAVTQAALSKLAAKATESFELQLAKNPDLQIAKLTGKLAGAIVGYLDSSRRSQALEDLSVIDDIGVVFTFNRKAEGWSCSGMISHADTASGLGYQNLEQPEVFENWRLGESLAFADAFTLAVGEPGRGSWNLPPTKVWDDILDAGEWVTAIDVLGTFDALQAWGVALRDFLKTKASHEHPRIAGMVHLYDLRTLERPQILIGNALPVRDGPWMYGYFGSRVLINGGRMVVISGPAIDTDEGSLDDKDPTVTPDAATRWVAHFYQRIDGVWEHQGRFPDGWSGRDPTYGTLGPATDLPVSIRDLALDREGRLWCLTSDLMLSNPPGFLGLGAASVAERLSVLPWLGEGGATELWSEPGMTASVEVDSGFQMAALDLVDRGSEKESLVVGLPDARGGKGLIRLARLPGAGGDVGGIVWQELAEGSEGQGIGRFLAGGRERILVASDEGGFRGWRDIGAGSWEELSATEVPMDGVVRALEAGDFWFVASSLTPDEGPDPGERISVWGYQPRRELRLGLSHRGQPFFEAAPEVREFLRVEVPIPEGSPLLLSTEPEPVAIGNALPIRLGLESDGRVLRADGMRWRLETENFIEAAWRSSFGYLPLTQQPGLQLLTYQLQENGTQRPAFLGFGSFNGDGALRVTLDELGTPNARGRDQWLVPDLPLGVAFTGWDQVGLFSPLGKTELKSAAFDLFLANGEIEISSGVLSGERIVQGLRPMLAEVSLPEPYRLATGPLEVDLRGSIITSLGPLEVVSQLGISGSVLDVDVPLAGIEVSLTSDGVERTTITDETGAYVFEDLLPGSYDLSVLCPQPEHAGPTSLTRTVVLTPSGAIDSVDFEFYRRSTIAGTIVRHDSGLPFLPLTAVELRKHGESTVVQGGFFEDGAFEFTGLSPGDYSVSLGTFGGSEYQAVTGEINVTTDRFGGASHSPVLRIQGGRSIAGSLAVDGMRIQWTGPNGSSGTVLTADGGFQIANLWAGSHTLRIESPIYEGGVYEVTVDLSLASQTALELPAPGAEGLALYAEWDADVIAESAVSRSAAGITTDVFVLGGGTIHADGVQGSTMSYSAGCELSGLDESAPGLGFATIHIGRELPGRVPLRLVAPDGAEFLVDPTPFGGASGGSARVDHLPRLNGRWTLHSAFAGIEGFSLSFPRSTEVALYRLEQGRLLRPTLAPGNYWLEIPDTLPQGSEAEGMVFRYPRRFSLPADGAARIVATALPLREVEVVVQSSEAAVSSGEISALSGLETTTPDRCWTLPPDPLGVAHRFVGMMPWWDGRPAGDARRGRILLDSLVGVALLPGELSSSLPGAGPRPAGEVVLERASIVGTVVDRGVALPADLAISAYTGPPGPDGGVVLRHSEGTATGPDGSFELTRLSHGMLRLEITDQEGYGILTNESIIYEGGRLDLELERPLIRHPGDWSGSWPDGLELEVAESGGPVVRTAVPGAGSWEVALPQVATGLVMVLGERRGTIGTIEPGVDPWPSLVAWQRTHHWSFDTGFEDDVSFNDGSSGGSVGILANTVARATGAGQLRLPGGVGHVDLPRTTRYAAEEPWTISFWATRGELGAQHGMILGETGNTKNFIWLNDNFDGLRFRSDGYRTYDFEVPKDQRRHHYVLVADGLGGLTLYLDGAAAGAFESADTSFAYNAIGQGYTTTSLRYAFEGEIDEVRAEPLARDADWVAGIFQGETPPPPLHRLVLNFVHGGQPVPDVQAQLIGIGASATSGMDGTVIFEEVPEGTAEIHFSVPYLENLPQSAEVTIPTNMVNRAEFQETIEWMPRSGRYGGYDGSGGLLEIEDPHAAAIHLARPLAYYRFERGSYREVLDHSGHGRDASSVASFFSKGPCTRGEAGLGARGKLPINQGQGGSFVLPCLLDPSAPGGASPDGSWSVEMLISPDNVGSFRRVLLSQQDGGGVGRNILTIANGRISTHLGGARLDGGHAVSAGDWHHVVLTASAMGPSGGRTLRLHVNGRLDGEFSGIAIESADGGWVFGASNQRNSGIYGGKLDEIAVYGRELSLEEIVDRQRTFVAAARGILRQGETSTILRPREAFAPDVVIGGAGRGVRLLGPAATEADPGLSWRGQDTFFPTTEGSYRLRLTDPELGTDDGSTFQEVVFGIRFAEDLRTSRAERSGHAFVHDLEHLIPGRRYRWWRSATMAPGSWEVIHEFLADASTERLSDPDAPDGAAFYRLEELPEQN